MRNMKRPLWFLTEAVPNFIYIKFFRRSNSRGKYADGFYNFMIADKEGQIPTPLIIYTCAAFRHSLLEWEKNGGAPPKARSKLETQAKQNPATYFNYKNDGGSTPSFLKRKSRSTTNQALLAI